MPTSPLTQFIRRLAVCLLALVVGVSTAVALLLLANNPPAHAQATESQTREAAKNHLTRGGSVGSPSLAPSPILTLTGEATYHRFGVRVATAGDVNNDGYDDVIVGASGYNGYTGRAYVFLGGANGLSAIPAFTATGETINNYFGGSVATAGDVNGDGYSDVIIGAIGYVTDTGRVYLYLGAVNGLGVTPALTLTGETTSGRFGQCWTAGDVNNDGYSDVIIGAPGYSNNTGKAYVYLGGASGLSSTAAFTATGEMSGDGFGSSVGTAGDVNADGYADVIIGAIYYGGAIGRAYVYMGGAGGLNPTPAFTATGEATPNFFSTWLGTAGDVNRDGYSDIVISAYNYGNGAGKIYVYLGGATGLNATAAFTATGQANFDFLGQSVGTAGDVNGDGYADIIVGANGYPSLGFTGRAYVYTGSANGLSATPAFTATGEAPDNDFGISAGMAGDVNGDGVSDVIIGAPGYSSYTGRAYIYLGEADILKLYLPLITK